MYGNAEYTVFRHSDRNECEDDESTLKCDVITERCVNTFGSYECECGEGYAKNESEAKCKNVDECLQKDVCRQNHEVCVDTEGSFLCECQKGFKRLKGVCQG